MTKCQTARTGRPVIAGNKVSKRNSTTKSAIPFTCTPNFAVKPYEEATGKTAPRKQLVTLCRRVGKGAMIALFLLERAWTTSLITPEEKLKTMEEQKMETSRGLEKELTLERF